MKKLSKNLDDKLKPNEKEYKAQVAFKKKLDKQKKDKK